LSALALLALTHDVPLLVYNGNSDFKLKFGAFCRFGDYCFERYAETSAKLNPYHTMIQSMGVAVCASLNENSVDLCNGAIARKGHSS
jgi:hypothetical protein